MASATPSFSDIISLGYDLQATKYYYIAAVTILCYEYILNFSAEVKHIWKGKKTLIFYLFMTNRYLPIAYMIITMTSYFSPAWTPAICDRYAVVEMLQTVLTTTIAEIFLMLRVYAVSGKMKIVVIFLVSIVLCQLGFALFVLSRKGNAGLPLPPIPGVDAFHLCVLAPALSIGNADTAYIFLTIGFDASVFFIILVCTIQATRSAQGMNLIKAIQRDSILYFAVIVSSNIVWITMVLAARPGLKFMHSEPGLILTPVMITRLALSLKINSQTINGTYGSSWRMQEPNNGIPSRLDAIPLTDVTYGWQRSTSNQYASFGSTGKL